MKGDLGGVAEDVADDSEEADATDRVVENNVMATASSSPGQSSQKRRLP